MADGPSPDATGPRVGAGDPLWLSFVDARGDGEGPGPERRVPLFAGRPVHVGGLDAACRVDVVVPGETEVRCVFERSGRGATVRASEGAVRIGAARTSAAELELGAVVELGETLVRLDSGPPGDPDGAPLAGLVGAGVAMRRLAAAVRRVAPLRLPVLVRGDTGTGKDLVARAIHAESRRSGPFVAINAAAIAPQLAESELFGHRRGAFTGAVRDRRGAFREADQGTLLLDEIASLAPELQAKLLRVVEEGWVRPLGSESSVAVDVRLVVATCEPLEAMARSGAFRADLYERLAVCVVRVPPLRDRPEDLAALARHLLGLSDLGDRPVTPGALALLRAHRWPGNVRELRNVIVQAALRSTGPVAAVDVAAVLTERAGGVGRRRVTPLEALQIYEEVGGNISAAARRAELPRTTMRDLLRAARELDALGDQNRPVTPMPR